MTAKKPKKKAPKHSAPNTYRVEFDEHMSVKFPTLVIWSKPPTLMDWSRFDEANPTIAKQGAALDSSGCVFRVERFEELVKPANDDEEAAPKKGTRPDRMRLTLPDTEFAELCRRANALGLTPTNYARMLVMQALQKAI